jgi:hypothetical protein
VPAVGNATSPILFHLIIHSGDEIRPPLAIVIQKSRQVRSSIMRSHNTIPLVHSTHILIDVSRGLVKSKESVTLAGTTGEPPSDFLACAWKRQ